MSQAKFEVASSAELGRFLVASEDIPAGSVILKEQPLATAGGDIDEAACQVTCLGCFKQDAKGQCQRCGWPVCDDTCSERRHHLDNECAIFAEKHISYPLPWRVTNKTILVLRCLLLKEKSPPDDWSELCRFEDHNDVRFSKKDCMRSDERILQSFSHFYGRELNEVEKNEILRISGILNVNAFTSLKRYGDASIISQCIFKTCSLFSHSCIPNCSWLIGDPPSLQMTIRSAILIRKGQMLTIPYSARENLAGTLQRLVSTEEVAHFQCKCPRCIDPTELNTFVSAVRCMSPSCAGFLLPITPTDSDSPWKCRLLDQEFTSSASCMSTVPVRKVVGIIFKAEQELDRAKRGIPKGMKKEEILKLLVGLRRDWERRIFHRNHYLVQEISLICIKYLGREAMDADELEIFIDSCRRLLTVADVITPGFSPHRIMILFHLAKGLKLKLKIMADHSVMRHVEDELKIVTDELSLYLERNQVEIID